LGKMKTSKATTTSKPKKTTSAGGAIKSRRVSSAKSAPSEEDIRKKAFEIYNQRLESGKYGTESDDWNEAEELLRKP